MAGTVVRSTRPQFSANLGFLWTDLSLPDAIRAAGAAGFDAVEFHQPFDFSRVVVADALAEANLEVISLNTGVGDATVGELGLAAMPGRQSDAQRLIDQAIGFAVEVGCRHVSVIAGRSGRSAEAEVVYRENLAYAAAQAESCGVGVLIEPLNTNVADDYHLVRLADGAATIEAIGAANLTLMADTFHVMTMEGSLDPIDEFVDHIGHIQISSWPARAEPTGAGVDEIEFGSWLPAILERGYAGLFGAEYNPAGTVENGLGWLTNWRNNDG